MANMNTGEVRDVARRAENQDALLMAARVGYAVNGVLHLLIGWIALSLAWGLGTSQSADQSGALGALASNTFGRILLWIAVIGWLGLGLWHLLQALLSRGEAKDRLKYLAKGVTYLVLTRLAFAFARGKRFDYGLAHGSTDLPPVGRLLRIPNTTMFDYEWARLQHELNCRLATRVLVPDAIPAELSTVPSCGGAVEVGQGFGPGVVADLGAGGAGVLVAVLQMDPAVLA